MKRWLIKGKEFIKNKKKFPIVVVAFIVILVALIVPSFAILTPVASVEIESEKLSYTSNTPGAWKITKSAKWIEKGKARITIDIDTKLKTNDNVRDVILVLDVSGSMSGDKLNRVKEDTLYLINQLIPTGNKIALITFDTESQILSDFTTDIDLLTTKINELVVTGATNYYQALINVDNILKNYTYQENRGCIALFLTDGFPCEDTPNQIPQYGYLKTEYPYLTINGIQYEMGDTILQPIVEVSDHQYIASLETLNTFLLKATVNPVTYSNLEITDYINTDYFTVEDVSSIRADVGKIKLQDNKVVWNLNTYQSGNKYTLTIDIKLKDELLGKGGIYPTNEKIEVKSKIEETVDDITSTKTPVLADNYKIIYEGNAPEGCTVTNVPEAMNASVYDVISMSDNKPTCEGYNFKGWKIVGDVVKKVNDDYFIMPEAYVTIRATWGRNSIAKSMEGTINVRQTLYKVLQDEAESDEVAREYTGAHQDSFNGGEKKAIYHYYAIRGSDAVTVKNKNNVIFAGQCWQMIRTTDTGGVKMIYNGEVEGGKCLDTRGTHVGYAERTSQNLASAYWYGTDYTYDSTAKTFKVSGTTEQVTWNATTGPGLVGKYTCKSTSVGGSCETLYLVESYYNTSSAYVIQLNSNSNYSQFGTLQFNASDNSPAYVGYMYNTIYPNKSMSNSSSGKIEVSTESVVSSGYTAIKNDATYPYAYDEATKQWSSSNHAASSKSTFEFSPTVAGEYYLSYIIGSEDTYDKATFYVDGTSKGTVSGSSTSSISLGTLTTSSVIKVEYSKDVSGSTQPDKVSFNLAKATGEAVDNRWYFGNDVTYENGVYTLVNHERFDLSSDYNKINNNHYTCNGVDADEKIPTTTCEKVKYIHYTSSSTSYYIELTGGKKVDDALNEMLYNDNVNTINSAMKSGIDAWYKHYMLDYDEYIEDTIFCNDRSIRELNGWNPNGGSTSNYLKFKEYNDTKDLSCTNRTDQFSISNNSAKLTYKVGLMSNPEMNLLGNDSALKTGQYYWLASPDRFNSVYAHERYVNYNGSLSWGSVDSASGVRPAVSLKPGIEYSDGDGSMENPYKIDLES